MTFGQIFALFDLCMLFAAAVFAYRGWLGEGRESQRYKRRCTAYGLLIAALFWGTALYARAWWQNLLPLACCYLLASQVQKNWRRFEAADKLERLAERARYWGRRL